MAKVETISPVAVALISWVGCLGLLASVSTTSHCASSSSTVAVEVAAEVNAY